ncbi:MAG: HNH endonuclease [Deltaproteobacteria bacterium]|nr:HNH endonuclease [Deltaproteobacteria bacterium]
MEKVLLLKATYEPLRIIPWQKAVTLLVLGKVEVLEEYAREIRSVHLTLRLPSVVRLIRFFFHRRPVVKFSRINIFIRDRFRCQYCGRSYPEHDLSLDHVVPQWMGGQKCWENIVTCCIQCNRKKGARTLAQAGMRLIRKPRKPAHTLNLGDIIPLQAPPPTWQEYLHHWDPRAAGPGEHNDPRRYKEEIFATTGHPTGSPHKPAP